MKSFGIVVALAAAAVAAWLAIARPWGGRPPRNVLIVTLDTLRADHVGAYGYAAAQTPRLDALAASGLRFTQATTVVPLTLPAHSSLFTGAFPGWHGVRDNGGFYLGDEQVTLAEVLRDRGFRTGAFVSAFVLDRRWGIGQGFERFHDEFDLDAFGDAPGLDTIQRPGAQTVDQAVAWLAADRERPFFAWVHLYDPHAPYEAPEPYRSRFPASMVGAYDAEIAATDAQVGRLLDALEVHDRLEDTLVVVLADHGEMLGEHEEQAHGFFVYDAAVHIPLIVAGPGVPSRVVPEQVRIVDVMPTVLDLLGVAAPKSVQGVSLRPLARGQPLPLVARSESWYPRYHYGWGELQSIQDGRFKYIRAPRPELYDLAADPRETSDLSRQEPQRLAALGYVGGSVSARHLEDRPRGDPKDKIGLYNLLKLAGTDSSERRYEDAIGRVRQVLSADPEVVEAYMLLGNFLKKSKRPDEAIAAYRQALSLDAEHQGALFSLALAYKDQNRLEEARVGFERARELDPRNGKVLWQLADLALRQHQPERAEEIVQDALTRRVDAHRFLLKRAEGLIERQRYDEAEEALRAALAQKADLPTAHYNLGLVYEARRQPERAIAEYEAELARSGKAYRAAFNLAKLLQSAGRMDEAIRRYRQAVDAQAGFGTGQLYLAKALLDTGDLAGAEEWARKGLESNPDARIAPLGHFVLADVYNRQGRRADAEREVARARRLQKSAT